MDSWICNSAVLLFDTAHTGPRILRFFSNILAKFRNSISDYAMTASFCILLNSQSLLFAPFNDIQNPQLTATVIRQMSQKFLNTDIHTQCTDITQAIDSNRRGELYEVKMRMGILFKTIKLVRMTMDNTRAKFKFGNKLIEVFSVQRWIWTIHYPIALCPTQRHE